MVHTFTQVKVGDAPLPGTNFTGPGAGSGGPWLLDENGNFILDEDGNKIPLE